MSRSCQYILRMWPVFALAAWAQAGPVQPTPVPIAEKRNLTAIAAIESQLVSRPFSFVMLGDTQADPNPVGDAIFSEMIRQINSLRPRPAFVAILGDFAGPGTIEQHVHHARLIQSLEIPVVTLQGNHDCDAGEPAVANFHRFLGPENFTFRCGNTRFVAIANARQQDGPDTATLQFLDRTLGASPEPVKIPLMHMPPYLKGHYAPRAGWGFQKNESSFLDILKRHDIRLVCCSHVIAYDRFVLDGITYVTSGGGGWGVELDFSYQAQAPWRRAVYHFVQLTVNTQGSISGQVFRAFEGTTPASEFSFTAH